MGETGPHYYHLLIRRGCGEVSRRSPFFARRRAIVCPLPLHSPRSRACISSVTCSAIRARSTGLVMPRNRHDIAPPCARLHFAWLSTSGSARGLSAARLAAWSASSPAPQTPPWASMGRWHRKQGAPGLVRAISARRARWCASPLRALLCGLRGTAALLRDVERPRPQSVGTGPLCTATSAPPGRGSASVFQAARCVVVMRSRPPLHEGRDRWCARWTRDRRMKGRRPHVELPRGLAHRSPYRLTAPDFSVPGRGGVDAQVIGATERSRGSGTR